MKVIIGDTNKTYRTMLSNTIRSKDNIPILVETGPEALKTYNKDPEVMMLFLDWNLPGMDGLEVASMVRKINHEKDRDCFIVLIGDKGGKYDIMYAMEMGANDILTKPFDSSTIDEMVDTAMDYFLSSADVDVNKETDPIEHLVDEHRILRFQAKKIEDLLTSVDEEAPNRLVDWMSGRIFVLETSVHQKKENEFSISFMERLLKAHGEENQALSESSSDWIEKEHQKLEQVVEEVQDHLGAYKKVLEAPPEPIENYNIMEHVSDFPAFCLKCKEKVVMIEPTIFQMETGNYSFKGKCPDCGSGVTSIIGKSIGASMKHVALKRTLGRYLKLLKEHLKREEDLYFPLASRYLTEGDKLRLLNEFQDIEKKHGISRMGKDFKFPGAK